MENFNFKDLVVLDLANNHQGQVEHGFKIIDAMAEIALNSSFRVGIKFQFRDLDSFIHPAAKASNEDGNQHIKRFLDTKLTWSEFEALKNRVHEHGMLAICTPFDEISVNKVTQMGFDIVKVASCSANDWPLLEKVAESGLPCICSTGGLLTAEVDKIVSFMNHRGVDFSLMHCVSLYPTPGCECNLGNIKTFAERYPDQIIGWSTHENPENLNYGPIAMALGAQMFERHVGVTTDSIKLNQYSSTPKQIQNWLRALEEAKEAIGSFRRDYLSDSERSSLKKLSRGVFAKRKIKAGELLTTENCYFAFPAANSGIQSSDWQEGIVADQTYDKDQAINHVKPELNMVEQAGKYLKEAIHEVKGLLNEASIILPVNFETEFSHHRGILNFKETGTTMITVINRDYCKKILVQLPGQAHPAHYHKVKEETFNVLSGELISIVDGKRQTLKAGEQCLVLPGTWHEFYSEKGCIFEEISTTHISNDSVYRDGRINKMTSSERKTIVDNWGRFQILDQLLDQKLSDEL